MDLSSLGYIIVTTVVGQNLHSLTSIFIFFYYFKKNFGTGFRKQKFGEKPGTFDL